MVQINDKKRILLHSCCGPCSTAVIQRLMPDYEITVFYFNPNITKPGEYEHRKAEQIRFLKEFCERSGEKVDFLEGDYDPSVYYNAVAGMEQEPEGKARCGVCFRLRLRETARVASASGFHCFDTTLSVSPHKNYDLVAQAGEESAAKYGIEYLKGNYKKQDGYKLSTELSKAYNLYRQNYCGCDFSEARP